MARLPEARSGHAPAPRVSVEDHCGGCAICERACPALAILWREHSGRALIAVADERCRACGTCVRNCPRGAMRLDDRSVPGAPVVSGARLVAIVDLRACEGCGMTFSSAGIRRCLECRRPAA